MIISARKVTPPRPVARKSPADAFAVRSGGSGQGRPITLTHALLFSGWRWLLSFIWVISGSRLALAHQVPPGGLNRFFKNKFECNNDIESWRLLYKRRPVRALSSDWFCFSFEFHLNVDRIHFLFFVHEPRMTSTWLIALTLFFYKMKL